MSNLVEIQACLGPQNAVTNFLLFGSQFARPVLSTGFATRDIFAGLDVLYMSTESCLLMTNLLLL